MVQIFLSRERRPSETICEEYKGVSWATEVRNVNDSYAVVVVPLIVGHIP